MKHFSLAVILALGASALLALTPAVSGSAAGSITGTVTAAGLSTNANAIVYVEHASGTFKPPAEPARMDQKSLKFVPEVLPILVGTTVRFLNSDSVAHNVFSPDGGYNLGTWTQGQSKEHAFTHCAKFPCVNTQLCLIHSEMQGFIVVLQNPYFAVTDAEGHYTIEGVAPGQYALGVWHPTLKAAAKPVTVDADKPVTVNFTLGR
jgi:plastocyanin